MRGVGGAECRGFSARLRNSELRFQAHGRNLSRLSCDLSYAFENLILKQNVG